MTRLEKSLAFAFLVLNGVGLVNNYIFADDHSKWREAVDVSTSPNSEAFFSFQQIPTATVLTTVTDVSSGQVLSWGTRVTNVTL